MEHKNTIEELKPVISGCCPNCGNPAPKIREWRDPSGVLIWDADSRGMICMNCDVCGIDFKMPVEGAGSEPFNIPTAEEVDMLGIDHGHSGAAPQHEAHTAVSEETFDIRGVTQGVVFELKMSTILGLPTDLVRDISNGLEDARRKHPDWPAEPHYGISAIREEFEELWEEVKNDGPVSRQRQEALDLIVTGCRYVLEVCDRDGK